MKINNRSSKWVSGFLMCLSFIMIFHFFSPFSLDGLVLMSATTLTYWGIYLLTTYKSIALKGLGIAIALILLIYSADFVLTLAQGNQSDVYIEKSQNKSSPTSNSESNVQAVRHNIKIVHTLKDAVDYHKVIRFGNWMVNERIEKTIINGEKIGLNKAYELYFLMSIVALLTLMIWTILAVKWLNWIVLMPIIGFIVIWYFYLDLPWTYSGLYFAGVLSFFIFIQSERQLSQLDGYRTSYYKSGRVMRITILFAGLIILAGSFISAFFPVKQVNFFVDLITPNIWGTRSGYESSQFRMYSLNETPYKGSNDILGGPVDPINSVDPLFWVKFDQPITEAVYLKTSIKDYYDGLKWMNNGIVYKNGFKYYLSDENNQKILKSGQYNGISGTVKLNPDEIKTTTLFTPMGLFETTLGDEKVYVSAENEAFYKAGFFIKHLKEYSFKASQSDFFISPDVDYLQLSDRIERKTLDLGLELGSFAKTDIEKIQLITNFLSQNYEYTLTPVSNYSRRDFVSQFLFEGKRGYCTYFASSLVILSRANGIPARYVEGFRVDPDEVHSDGSFSKVTEKDAHAWAEVYLKDYGWVIFESTPSYSEAQSTVETPTLAMLTDEEKENVAVTADPSIENTNFGPVDVEGLLMEGDGGLKKGSEITVGKRRDQSISWIWFFYIGLGLVAIIGMTLFWILPIGFMKRQNTHAYAVRSIYFLTYLMTQAKDGSHFDPEVILENGHYLTREKTLWYKILYAPANKVSSQEIVESIDLSTRYTKIAKENYILKKGRFSYLKLRYFKVHIMIP